jgi:hypothetical protein
MKKAVFWDVAQCRYCVNRRSSETSVNTISILRHIPEDCFLHSHRRENLKSYNSGVDPFLGNVRNTRAQHWNRVARSIFTLPRAPYQI